MLFSRLVALAAVGVLGAAPAHAVIVTGSLTGGNAVTNGGTFQQVTSFPTGFTVGGNNFGDNDVRAFNELQGVTLLSNLAVRGGSIAAGTLVNSHFLTFDPLVSRRAIGSVSFAQPILGIITTTATLNASNFLGIAPVTYSFVSASGLEGSDVVSFSGNSLSFDLRASNPSDSIRIITRVPEPGTWAMLIAGFGLVGAAARRRRVVGTGLAVSRG